MTTEQQPRPTRTGRSGPWLSRSWFAVVLIPLSFLPALGVAYLVYDLLGYQPENDDAPWWVDTASTIPAVVVFLVPCMAAVYYGVKAHRSGDRRGLVPLVIAAIAGLWWIIISLIGLLGG